MAVVPCTVTISPPSYTITVSANKYTFVFDPRRYSSAQAIRNFIVQLKLGQLGSIAINETDQLWSDFAVLRLGKLIMVRSDELVREFTLMLGAALELGQKVNRDASDNYPSQCVAGEVITITISENVSYKIPITAVTSVKWSERSTHLRNLESGDLGTLVLDYDRVRIKFVVGESDVEISFSEEGRTHSIKKSRAQAYFMLLKLYNVQGGAGPE